MFAVGCCIPVLHILGTRPHGLLASVGNVVVYFPPPLQALNLAAGQGNMETIKQLIESSAAAAVKSALAQAGVGSAAPQNTVQPAQGQQGHHHYQDFSSGLCGTFG